MEENKAKVLLILHGWGSNAERWQAVARLLEQKGVKAIIPDLPGFGKNPEPSRPWGVDDYVQWVADFVSKTPQLQHGFCLLGHSFGGAVAVKFTLQYAQSVEKLFLVAAALVRQKTETKKAARTAAKLVKVFSFVPGYELFRKACYKFFLRSDYLYVSGVMKETYLNIIADDLSQKVLFVRVPTVLIWGDKDQSTPLEESQFIHKKIENSVLEIIPGGEHALQIKMPEIMAEKILEHV